jgi:hypothetical protein
MSHFVLLVRFGHLKDTSDSPLLLRFNNLQEICYTNYFPYKIQIIRGKNLYL